MSFRIAAITDEFTPDLKAAAAAMEKVGMTGAELRMIGDKNIIDLTDAELNEAKAICAKHKLEIISIASPLLKCTLPTGPAVDPRFQQDVFAAKHGFEDQPRLTKRAFEIARSTGAKIVRVFSYWRTVEPDKCFDAIVSALRHLADAAKKEDLIIGLENEFACNLATASETARVLAVLDHPNLKMVWDPANSYMSGENPFPEGYAKLPAARIVHIHSKDCDQNRAWTALGEGKIDWKGQIKALTRANYRGWISLETHWKGPNNDKMEASEICGRNLAALVQQP